MRQFKIFSFLLVCIWPFFIVGKVSEFQTIYVGAVRCNLSEKFYYKNYSCFAKSYSRNFSTLNFIATSKMPLYNIFVSYWNKNIIQKKYLIYNEQAEIKILFKYGLVYRDVMASPKVDVCEVNRQLLRSENPFNRFVFSIFTYIKDSYPQMIRECPHHVQYFKINIFM